MNPVFAIPILAVVVIVLIRAEILHLRNQIYVLKPLATLLVIAIAGLSLLRPSIQMVYCLLILAGLCFSLGGDLALMFQENRRAFTIGLTLFLTAHLMYVIAFCSVGSVSWLDAASFVVLAALGFGFYQMVKPNLGTMRLPVIIYIGVISVMVNRAVATLASAEFSVTQALLVIVGAVLFYISDLILAAARFWRPWRYNRISLAFYYTGQLLIALSGHGGWNH